jgi:hypothetical protein
MQAEKCTYAHRECSPYRSEVTEDPNKFHSSTGVPPVESPAGLRVPQSNCITTFIPKYPARSRSIIPRYVTEPKQKSLWTNGQVTETIPDQWMIFTDRIAASLSAVESPRRSRRRDESKPDSNQCAVPHPTGRRTTMVTTPKKPHPRRWQYCTSGKEGRTKTNRMTITAERFRISLRPRVQF